MWIMFVIAIIGFGMIVTDSQTPLAWVVVALAAVMLFRIMMPVADIAVSP
jgi:hypothetical protein